MKTTTAPLHKKIGKLNGLNGFVQIRAARIGKPDKQMTVDESECVFNFWRKVICKREWFDPEKETMIVLSLSHGGHIVAWHLVSIGSHCQTYVSVPCVFRPVIVAGVSRIIMIHNHPSGSLKVSEPDKMLTERILMTGDWLGIRLLDHVIVTDKDYCSIRESHPELFRIHTK